MQLKISYRVLKKKDIPSIISLVHELYPLKRSAEFINWQCFENVNPVRLIGGFIGNELIGMFGIQKRILSNNAIAGQLSWLNISKKWHGFGLFENLGKRVIDYFNDLDLICVFGNSNALGPCNKSFGMREIGKLNIMKLENRNIKSLYHSNKIFPFSSSEVFKNYDNGRVFFVKDERYRLWRYFMSPVNTYFTTSLETGEYAIFKYFNDPINDKMFGDIVEIGYSNQNKNGLRKILMLTCNEVFKNRVTSATLWALPGTGLKIIAETLGFKETEDGSYFLIKVNNRNFEYLYDINNWDLTQSDATNY